MNAFDLTTIYCEARRLWWLLLLIVAGCLGLGYWLFTHQSLRFTSEAKMVVAGKISLDAGSTYNEEKEDFLGTQAVIMQSDDVIGRANKTLAARGMSAPKTPVDLKVTFIPRTEIFLLDATSTDPVYTQAFLQGALQAFFDIRKEMRMRRSEAAQSAVSQEVVRVQKELDQATQELNTFQRRFSIVSLEEDVTATTSYLNTLHKRIADLRLQRSVATTGGVDPVTAGWAIPTGADDGTDAGGNGNTTGGTQPQDRLLAAQQDLAIQQSERNRLLENLRPQHPKIKELDIKIAEDQKLIAMFDSQLNDRKKNQIAAIDRETEALEKDVQQKQDHLLDLNNNLAQYQSLKSKADGNRETYNKLIAGIQSIDVGKQVEQEPITILEDASPAKLIPKHVFIALAQSLFVGLALGFGLIMVWSRFLPRFQTISSIKRTIELPIFGKILRDRWMSYPRTVLECTQAHQEFAESVRNLRSGVLNRPEEFLSKRFLALTSAVPNEGKSTVAVNLSIALAATNARTLLIDGDLRRGRLHQSLGLPQATGLSDLITGQRTLSDVLLTTRMQNLSLLPCGPRIQNGAELLLRYALDDLFRELYSHFDYIILDTPPVLAATDAITLAAKADWTMFVVRLGYSQPRDTVNAIEELTAHQIRVPGIVANCVPRGQTSQSYHHYYHQIEHRPFLEWTNGQEAPLARR